MHAPINMLSNSLFTPDQLIPLGLIVAVITFLLISARRKLQGRGRYTRDDDSVVSKPARAPQGSKEQLRRDLESLIVELQELSRRISAEIDTRFAKLEAAMRDADRRIACLNRLARQNGSQPVTQDEPDDPKPEPSNDVQHDVPPAPPASAKSAGKDTDDRHQIIYELADAGFSPIDIARDLGKTPGEVELILNLRDHASWEHSRGQRKIHSEESEEK